MTRLAVLGGGGGIVLSAGSALAACDNDASTETVLGAGSGALVGGLASHSVVGAAVGGVAGGLIGNSIGHSNNREDCRREAREAYYDREAARNYYRDYPDRDRGYYVDRYGYRHYDYDDYD